VAVVTFNTVQMAIVEGSNTSISLGLPFFSAFYVSIDRYTGRYGFAPGCGCQQGDKSRMVYLADLDQGQCNKTYSAPPHSSIKYSTTPALTFTSTSTSAVTSTSTSASMGYSLFGILALLVH
jgi:hypothetical protein